MNESISLGLAIFGAVLIWTTSVIGGMVWLNAKFRSHESILYRELAKLRRELAAMNYSYNTRIQRLEIKAFGFTGGNGTAVEPDDGKTFP